MGEQPYRTHGEAVAPHTTEGGGYVTSLFEM